MLHKIIAENGCRKALGTAAASSVSFILYVDVSGWVGYRPQRAAPDLTGPTLQLPILVLYKNKVIINKCVHPKCSSNNNTHARI